LDLGAIFDLLDLSLLDLISDILDLEGLELLAILDDLLDFLNGLEIA
jgi:hypothetical protein